MVVLVTLKSERIIACQTDSSIILDKMLVSILLKIFHVQSFIRLKREEVNDSILRPSKKVEKLSCTANWLLVWSARSSMRCITNNGSSRLGTLSRIHPAGHIPTLVETLSTLVSLLIWLTWLPSHYNDLSSHYRHQCKMFVWIHWTHRPCVVVLAYPQTR